MYDCIGGVPWGSSVFLGVPGPTFLSSSSGLFDSILFSPSPFSFYHLLCPRNMSWQRSLVEFWGLPPLILFFNMSIGWFGRFVLSTECYRTRKLGYKDLNWPRCSARVTESLALTDGGFCQKQTLYV